MAWAFGLSSRSESSPIALYDEQGNGWIVQCEQKGTVHLLDGLTGSEVSSLDLQAEIEASPAAYNNVVVIGTTGKGTSFVTAIEVKLEGAPEKTDAEQQPEQQAEQQQDENGPEQPGENEGEPEQAGNEDAETEEPEDDPGWPGDEGGVEDEED